MADEPEKEPLPRIPTPDFSRALKTRSGALYQAVVEVVSKANPRLTPEEVTRGLQELLGPQSPEDVFYSRRRIPLFPNEVTVNGSHIRILESDPVFIMNCLVSLGALRAAVWKSFGGPDGYASVRKEFVAEGGKADDFDRHFLREMQKNRDDSIERARRNAGGSTPVSATAPSTERGCATVLFLIALASCAFWFVLQCL